MRPQTRAAVAACLAMIAEPYTDEEHRQRSRPPYPLPDRVLPHQAVAVAQLTRLVESGFDGSCLTDPRMIRPTEWRSLAQRVLLLGFHWRAIEALILIVAAGDVSPAELEAIVPAVGSAFDRNLLRGQLIHMLLDAGDVPEAERVCDSLEPQEFDGSDWRFYGHRYIARWFAERGDAPEFLARWKALNAGAERFEMARLKGFLVSSVSRRHDWRAGLAVTADRRIGPRFRHEAFRPLAQDGAVAELMEAFSAAHEPDLVTEVEQLDLLAKALSVTATRTGFANREPFSQILDRIIALDTSDKATMRARDAMLVDLWPAYPDHAALTRARKAARTPRNKSELVELHPEVIRPDDVPVIP
jgi:hypothetical protein